MTSLSCTNRSTEHPPKKVSVVVPLFNEEGNIRLLSERLDSVLEGIRYDHEVIFIDDGSTDRTWDALEEVSRLYPKLKAYRFPRNFGHQNALFAGLEKAAGDAVISMDGDLQHPPELIPELISKWEEGYKIVHTARQDPYSTGILKRTTSRGFYKFFSVMAGFKMPEGSSDFRLIDRQALCSLFQFQDSSLFLRGAFHWMGFSSTTVPFTAQERHSGASKYGFTRMIRLATTASIAYTGKPLHLAIGLGMLTSGFAFIELIYILVQFTLGNTVPGWASILGFSSLLFGLLFIVLGIIGLYLGDIHKILQNRPRYIISQRTLEKSKQ
ncbi:MAG: glycosyltransferase [Desulfobacteraceae bacterium]|nr:MAG: glycosyltransferase [Desulfobacteraceae bacterium]